VWHYGVVWRVTCAGDVNISWWASNWVWSASVKAQNIPVGAAATWCFRRFLRVYVCSNTYECYRGEQQCRANVWTINAGCCLVVPTDWCVHVRSQFRTATLVVSSFIIHVSALFLGTSSTLREATGGVMWHTWAPAYIPGPSTSDWSPSIPVGHSIWTCLSNMGRGVLAAKMLWHASWTFWN